jgi:hypothetical protein
MSESEVFNFKFGFTYKVIPYGFKDKKLYRLPYNRNFRFYSLKEIKPHLVQGLVCYNCARTKLTINRLKQLTQPIDVQVTIYKNNNLPF